MFKVLSGRHVDTWHYHGSWFEYKWSLELQNVETNEIISGEFWTGRSHNNLDGKTIKIYGKDFDVIYGNA